jgi:heme/copper-type cytochrome/quinol oxidase subunit 3
MAASATASTPTTTGRATTPTLVAALAGVVVVVMSAAALGGAYATTRYSIRRSNPGESFFPSSMKFNNYAAFIVFFTLIMGSLAIGWGVTSLKVGNRRWAGAGFGIAIITDLAALNIMWFIGSGWEAAVNALPWWLHTYALLAVAMIAGAVALVAAGLGLARVVTAQATPEQPHTAIAAAWMQHAALVVWIIVYLLIFLYK